MYTTEFEFNTSTKLLFPYINTPGGLQQWFAEEVRVKRQKVMIMVIDDQEYGVEITNEKPLRQVRLEFLNDDFEREKEPYFVEFELSYNDMTSASYLTINDESGLFESEEEFKEVWEGLIYELRSIIMA